MSLRFESLELFEVRLPFRLAFRHATAERSHSDTILVRLRGDGVSGLGEALPRSYLTGESLESVWQDLTQLWWPALRDLRFTSSELPFAALAPLYEQADSRRKTAGYAAIDIAVFDAWARYAQKSGQSMLGPPKHPQPYTATIGLGKSAPLFAQALRWHGFTDFKLKLAADDISAATKVRRALGPTLSLRVDANAAWTWSQALTLAPELLRLGITSCEEPLLGSNPHELARFHQESGLAVVADESLCTTSDARDLAEAGAAGVWNLRLGKVGGFSGLKKLVSIAEQTGTLYQFGSLVGETSILQNALRAALALGSPSHAEYGFTPILLAKEPLQHAAARRFLPTETSPLSSAYGLGLMLDEAALRKYVRRYDVLR